MIIVQLINSSIASALHFHMYNDIQSSQVKIYGREEVAATTFDMPK